MPRKYQNELFIILFSVGAYKIILDLGISRTVVLYNVMGTKCIKTLSSIDKDHAGCLFLTQRYGLSDKNVENLKEIQVS